MTRLEHLEWCKQRAIEEMDFYHEPKKGVISMMSDLNKHPETSGPALQALCMMTLLKHNLSRQDVIDFVNGFN